MIPNEAKSNIFIIVSSWPLFINTIVVNVMAAV